jgi:hypothetical protein
MDLYISHRKITCAVNCEIGWKRKRVKGRRNIIHKGDRKAKERSVAKIIYCLIEDSYCSTTRYFITNLESAANGIDSKRDDLAPGDITGSYGRVGMTPVENAGALGSDEDLGRAGIAKGESASLAECPETTQAKSE